MARRRASSVSNHEAAFFEHSLVQTTLAVQPQRHATLTFFGAQGMGETMAKSTKAPRGNGNGPPDPEDLTGFRDWLEEQPRDWSMTIAARAALRVLPLVNAKNLSVIALHVFRATAIARFAAKYPNRAIDVRSAADAAFSANASAVYADTAGSSAYAASDAAYATYAATATAGYAANTLVSAGNARASAASAVYSAAKYDAQRLHDGVLTAEQLARDQLWPFPAPAEIGESWQRLSMELLGLGHHWQVWTDWYQYVSLQEPHSGITEAEDAAFTDIPGKLPWDDGAEAVNNEIVRRLDRLSRGEPLSEIPDQSPAPVRVEERDAKVAQASDRDSPLSATERDFRAWRDPVVGHIDELTVSDFAAGTNHSRIRDRLTALGKLLPGEISEVKERQFHIGYEIERFEGLMAAYRAGGEDMPMLNAAQLEDLDRLRVALKMGIDKLERWSEFRKQANESTAGEADADRVAVSDALDEMAAAMEQQPKYFDPDLPASFRFLAEAVRDPSGATRTVVYGAVKSAENLVSFLGQRALGIGKKGVEAVEAHISKVVAASLIAGLSSAALGLSGALPQGWAWLKPLLAALGAGG